MTEGTGGETNGGGRGLETGGNQRLAYKMLCFNGSGCSTLVRNAVKASKQPWSLERPDCLGAQLQQGGREARVWEFIPDLCEEEADHR